ncbi:hypothetical protein BLA29_006946 [Euroglyphus maynei]|uniref:Uncharacterized protein n=1 Tax=Euroglyphus maynei TaxID=6958 RepID=A0A1Y3AZ11_EURMA|nr:hypothetical protein BLA29_006946 [Euroglyphus maynei]
MFITGTANLLIPYDISLKCGYNLCFKQKKFVQQWIRCCLTIIEFMHVNKIMKKIFFKFHVNEKI